MAPKRKSDAIELPSVDVLPKDNDDSSIKENSKPADDVAPIFKKARVSDPEVSSSTSKGKKKATAATPKVTRWQDVELEGEDVRVLDSRVISCSARSILTYCSSGWISTYFVCIRRVEPRRTRAYLSLSSDDCNDIRRKIRALQKTPGWKVCNRDMEMTSEI